MSIDDYRDDSIANTPLRVASPAMPKPVLLQFTVHDCQLKIIGHVPRAGAPTEDNGRLMKSSRFTLIQNPDGSSNRNYVLHDSIESSTLRMLRGVLEAAMQ